MGSFGFSAANSISVSIPLFIWASFTKSVYEIGFWFYTIHREQGILLGIKSVSVLVEVPHMILMLSLKFGIIPIVVPVGVRDFDMDGEHWVNSGLIPTEAFVGVVIFSSFYS
ncbi:uncharacterized protein LOC125419654 [Ziziphus jujuba]|uniref:Uncharacterized protein LOC125419654 n=1 Tax=Ziziphus jujuba TaxID=326968 RepID=A0ABM3ZW49_ZIZJJ|nr:uncharacterized protein LOC125419654 [Ziziphus jujuba]